MRQLLLLILVVFLTNSTQAQFRTKFTDVHFNYVFTSAIDPLGKSTTVSDLGDGLAVNTGTEHFSGFLEYNYHRINLQKLGLPDVKGINYHDFYLGLRYYPLKPTFLAGNTAFRLSAAAAVGLDLEPNWRGMFMLGIFISPILETSGIAIHALYYPGKYTASGYQMRSNWAIRVSFILGVSARKNN